MECETVFTQKKTKQKNMYGIANTYVRNHEFHETGLMNVHRYMNTHVNKTMHLSSNDENINYL